MDLINGNAIDMSKCPKFLKRVTVRAFLSADGITYYKEWGRQVLPGAHYVIIGENNDVYGCAIEEFRQMYELIPGYRDRYRKNTPVRGIKMEDSFYVKTITNDGNIEVKRAHGRKGDWLVEDVGGERHIIKKSKFKKLYEPFEKSLPNIAAKAKSPLTK